MAVAISGVVRGKVIELDEAVPGLEGMRVRVIVEAFDEKGADPVEMQHAWVAWAAAGPPRASFAGFVLAR
jgi:hypothetical protein